MTIVFENLDTGEHTSVHIPDDTDMPAERAMYRLRRNGRWEIIAIERYDRETP